MRVEDTGNCYWYEGWGITSGEEVLSEVGSIGVEIIRVAADSPNLDDQGKGYGVLGG